MRTPRYLTSTLITILAAGLLAAAPIANSQNAPGYKKMNLVSDIAGVAPKRDKRLVNPWGIVAGPSGPLWVSNEESHLLTGYNRAGVAVRNQDGKLSVDVPNASNQRGEGRPTGIVYNGTDDFTLVGDFSAPATFIVVTLDGLITGWNADLSPENALVMLDNSASGAVYTGAALASGQAGTVLAVANFTKGTVDIYDTHMQLIKSVRDERTGDGFAPFNVQNIDGQLYVAFAKRNDEGEEEPGPGLGYVDIFTADGDFVREFASEGTLNAPWAIVRSPADFGEFSNSILVGNFGDGRITAFDPQTGEFRGQIDNRRGEPLEIEGLWGLAFGNGGDAGRTNWLYFTAGIDSEVHGLFGRISAQSQGGN